VVGLAAVDRPAIVDDPVGGAKRWPGRSSAATNRQRLRLRTTRRILRQGRW